ncbi:hypothetical protein BGW36DRAFT_432063 [Talaromyces proteolyticus]|uniref:Uncharacterized protein n=1 Tax=Talaromyces proteolyticus TaxID=1131652 RepID=A0AAD4KG38_9EURO|nr:uncharacterized protein BGW36DRAFT_432063 [Talaromyces proteolyticus]KAH8691513.1 hypothetical protein BGW36DRAFT_432063 [Talaromyces proteolyticus]
MASQSLLQQSLESYKTTSSVQDFHRGGDGIGLALVKAVAEFGGHVAVIGQREVPHPQLHEIQDIHEEIKVKYFCADVSQESLLTKVFDQILADFGRIDGVIACAGVCVEKPFVEHTWEDVVQLQMVNSVGLFFTVQLAVKAMLQNRPGQDEHTPKGSVILIGSIATDIGCESQGLTAYSASKGAAKGLLHSLAVELAPKGIRVNMISPGHTITDMSVSQWKTRPELETVMKNAVPMGRMAERRDLKGAAVYFLSDASLYTTGSNLIISGGIHAGRL